MTNQLITKATQAVSKVGFTISKHSPIILTAAGIAGLGATAYFSYKAHGKIESIVEDMEASQEVEVEIEEREELVKSLREQLLETDVYPEDLDYDLETEESELAEMKADFVPLAKTEILRRVAGAIALPVLTGTMSVCAIGLSYYIQNNRIKALAGALAATTAQHIAYQKRVADKYGEEVARKMEQPVEVKKQTIVDEKGKEKEKDVETKVETKAGHYGAWFSDSQEYFKDDHQYNIQFIKTKEAELQLRLFTKGYLRLNEVLDKLGLPRTRGGELVGWTGASSAFELFTETADAFDDNYGMMIHDIYITWPATKYIYDDVDYEGRYA